MAWRRGDAPRQFDLCTATNAPRGPNETISASQRSALCGFACGRPSPRRLGGLTGAGATGAAGAGALSSRRSTSSCFFPPTLRPCARSLSFSTGTVRASNSLRDAAARSLLRLRALMGALSARVAAERSMRVIFRIDAGPCTRMPCSLARARAGLLVSYSASSTI